MKNVISGPVSAAARNTKVRSRRPMPSKDRKENKRYVV